MIQVAQVDTPEELANRYTHVASIYMGLYTQPALSTTIPQSLRLSHDFRILQKARKGRKVGMAA